jgi:hypothetical protein
LIAASTASEPFDPKYTWAKLPDVICTSFAASSIALGCTAPQQELNANSRICRLAASTISSRPYPIEKFHVHELPLM